MRRKVYEDEVSGPVEPMSKAEEDEITTMLPADWEWFRGKRGGQRVAGIYGYWIWSQPQWEGCRLDCYNSPRLIKEAIKDFEQAQCDAGFVDSFTAGVIRRFS